MESSSMLPSNLKSTKKKPEQKDPMEREKIEKEILDMFAEKERKINELKAKNANLYDILNIALEKPPRKSELKEVKDKYIELVNKWLSQIKFDAPFTEYLKKLSIDQATILLEYVLKNLQNISEGGSNASAPLMLKLHSKIIEIKGYGIQIRAISTSKPLQIKKINNFLKERHYK